jgi:hypothetical protein
MSCRQNLNPVPCRFCRPHRTEAVNLAAFAGNTPETLKLRHPSHVPEGDTAGCMPSYGGLQHGGEHHQHAIIFNQTST